MLQFGCSVCGVELTVPAELAGAVGPCPCCGNWVAAPTLREGLQEGEFDWLAALDDRAAQELPCDAAAGLGDAEALRLWIQKGGAGDPVTGDAAGGAIREGEPAAAHAAASAAEAEPLESERQPTGEAASGRSRRPEWSAGALEERRRRAAERHAAWKRQRLVWGAVAAASLLVMGGTSLWVAQLAREKGSLHALLLSLRGEKPPRRSAMERMVQADSALAASLEKQRELEERQRLLLEAQQALYSFLTAADWNEARRWLLPGSPAGAPEGFERLPRLALARERVRLLASHRSRDGQLFSSWRAGEGDQGLSFIVEPAPEGPRLRWDLLDQQMKGALAAFCGEPGGAGRFYVRLRPLEPLSDKGLAVEITSPFGGADACRSRAVIPPQAGADDWRRLLELSQPRETLARLRWRRGSGSDPVLTVEPLQGGLWQAAPAAMASLD